MEQTGLPAYDLMVAAASRGHLVALIPTTDVDGTPLVYMRHVPITAAESPFTDHEDKRVRATVAFGFCQGARKLAVRRGFTPVS